jgi:hypothetical protein
MVLVTKNGIKTLMAEVEITIHTGRDSFIMLDAITSVNATQISGIRSFSDEPLYAGLEALAQLGAFHVRYATAFDRHVFLLKIGCCCLSAGESLKGKFTLSGELLNRSDSAFYCRLMAKKAGQTTIEGEFLFAAVDYDQKFKREILRTHYEKTFLCLLNDIEPG